ncbi:hypothetical protein HU200_045239 [Digitaria exilis]|uniref:Uncharacterized protein n=1 Tax=Digitaria exilis TaxID=1010633 RepID=A0A835B035_9POAL|nr:hypothetical protein HU200_045239 [Digitaria exilis]CAB3493706.1 unnamed protein product [Digitaria exilis]
MQSAARAVPTCPPDAVDVPGRPAYVDSSVQGNLPTPATAEPTPPTPPHERRTSRPEMVLVYMPAPSPEMCYFGRCFAHAYITPSCAPCKAHPAPFIRAAIGAVLPGLKFELMYPSHGADKMVRFPSPEDREAAMDRQPFELDGASVKLVREGETSNVRRVRKETLAHVALHGYPRELRSVEEIRSRCTSFGHLFEVDPACFDAPDLSPVRVVVRMERAREIPRQVRISWMAGAFRHVVPVQILKVWNSSESVDAKGHYVPIYGAAGVVPP